MHFRIHTFQQSENSNDVHINTVEEIISLVDDSPEQMLVISKDEDNNDYEITIL